MKNTALDIGTRIKFLRQAKGLSQEQLALLISRRQSHVCHYERGRCAPTTYIIFELCKVFGCTADWLITGREVDVEVLHA